MSASSTDARLLLAGVARVNITPPMGIRLLGYTVHEGCSQDVERELTATVLVLSDGATSGVVLSSTHWIERMSDTSLMEREWHRIPEPSTVFTSASVAPRALAML